MIEKNHINANKWQTMYILITFQIEKKIKLHQISFSNAQMCDVKAFSFLDRKKGNSKESLEEVDELMRMAWADVHAGTHMYTFV